MAAVLPLPGLAPACFGVVVPPCITSAWSDDDESQVIAQAELLPVLLAKLVWPSAVVDAPALVFVDNDGARHSLAGGSSTNEAAAAIVGASAIADATLGCHQWVARVPAGANPAALNLGLWQDWEACAFAYRRLGPWPTGPVSSAYCEKGGTSGAEPVLSTGAHIGSPVSTHCFALPRLRCTAGVMKGPCWPVPGGFIDA